MKNIFHIRINDISTLDDALFLSQEIFLPSQKEKKEYHDKTDWLNKIKDNGLLISAYNKNKCIAFAICYKKDNSKLHIWNVGVSTAYRKQGVWKSMYDKIIEYGKNMNYKEITLNTYKEKFPKMYSFVKREGFVLINEERSSEDLVKSRFKRKIS